MAKLSTDLSARVLHPRENLFATANLGSINAEVIIDSDGAASVALDLRGTFSMTVELSGTVDGANWTPIPVKPVNQAAKIYVAAVTGAVAGLWVGSCIGYRKVRARVTAYTSGAAAATISASNAALDQSLDGMITGPIVTATGAAAAAVTLTLPAPGLGLRQYVTYLSVNRFASVLLTAAATPVLVTTTNFSGALVLSLPADAAAAGSLYPWREDFAFPAMAAAQNTAMTIVCPATTGVIWRATAGYYVAP